MLYGYVIILSSILLLIGYAIGRRIGIQEGIKKGRTLHAISTKFENYWGHDSSYKKNSIK